MRDVNWLFFLGESLDVNWPDCFCTVQKGMLYIQPKNIYKIKKEEKKKKRHALQGLSYALLSYTNFFVLLLGGLCRISLPLKIGLLIGGIEVITFVFSAGKNWVRYHLLYFLGANHVVKPKACMVRQLSKVNNCSHCTLFYLLKHRPAGCSSW